MLERFVFLLKGCSIMVGSVRDILRVILQYYLPQEPVDLTLSSDQSYSLELLSVGFSFSSI